MKSEDFISQARGLLGVDQEAFGRLLGVSMHTIYRYERGGVVPEPIEKLTLEVLKRHGHRKQWRIDRKKEK